MSVVIETFMRSYKRELLGDDTLVWLCRLIIYHILGPFPREMSVDLGALGPEEDWSKSYLTFVCRLDDT